MPCASRWKLIAQTLPEEFVVDSKVKDVIEFVAPREEEEDAKTSQGLVMAAFIAILMAIVLTPVENAKLRSQITNQRPPSPT